MTGMNDNTPPQTDTTPLCSGFGQRHTDKFTRKYTTITWQQIKAMVDNPQQVEKADAQWVIPSTLMTRTFADQDEMGSHHLLWADLDKDCVSLNLVARVMDGLGCDYEIYTSRSATREKPKARILLPLVAPLSGTLWKRHQLAFIEWLGQRFITGDTVAARSAQLCFLPNRGEYYYSHSKRLGTFYSPTWALPELPVAEVRAAADPGQQDPVVTAFNKIHTIPEILLRNNYKMNRAGEFMHPKSEGGSYSASIFEETGRVTTMSDSDPLWVNGTQSGHDAFSCFCVLEHDGKFTAAQAAAKEEPAINEILGAVMFDTLASVAPPPPPSVPVSGGGVAPPPPPGQAAPTVDPAVIQALVNQPGEDSMALAFAHTYKGRYVYIHDTGKWHKWTGTHWAMDMMCSIELEIRNMSRSFNRDNTISMTKRNFYSNVEALCRNDPAFARVSADFDSDNYLLNTPGGTYNLLTGKRLPHNPADSITKITSKAPEAGGSRVFEKFLDEITDGDKELALFLQRSLGAMLSGAQEEHWLMFWTGKGRNGKNTLGDRVQHVMGEYATAVPSSTLMSQKNAEHATEIMSLMGRRMVMSSEIEEDAYFAVAKINELTGDTTMKGRYMRQDWVTFDRTHKHLIYGNNRPKLSSVSDAIRARMKVVPFKVSFKDREDGDLPAKLKRDEGHILTWLMEGHQMWLDAGKKIGSCAAVDAELDDYMDSQSTPEMWIEECCSLVPDTGQVNAEWNTSAQLYASYQMWKQMRGEKPMGQGRFSEWGRNSFDLVKTKTGKKWKGIRLDVFDYQQQNSEQMGSMT
jgi:P4 family phage/plasmid primase-like protien